MLDLFRPQSFLPLLRYFLCHLAALLFNVVSKVHFFFRRANWRDFPRDTDYRLTFIQFSLYSAKILYPLNINIRTRFDIRLIPRTRLRTGFLSCDPGRRLARPAAAAADQRRAAGPGPGAPRGLAGGPAAPSKLRRILSA